MSTTEPPAQSRLQALFGRRLNSTDVKGIGNSALGLALALITEI